MIYFDCTATIVLCCRLFCWLLTHPKYKHKYLSHKNERKKKKKKTNTVSLNTQQTIFAIIQTGLFSLYVIYDFFFLVCCFTFKPLPSFVIRLLILMSRDRPKKKKNFFFRKLITTTLTSNDDVKLKNEFHTRPTKTVSNKKHFVC